jgi:hypothetical protein
LGRVGRLRHIGAALPFALQHRGFQGNESGHEQHSR